MVFPFAQGSKYAEFTRVDPAALLQCVDDFSLGAAQEGVGGFFQCDGGGQGGQVCCSQLLSSRGALLQGVVVWFAGQREAQISGGVFMGAIDTCDVRQLGKTLQRAVQLCERSFEIPAAARAKQHVAAEHHSRCDKGDVVVEVAGNFYDVEGDGGRGQLELVALAHIIGDMRIVRMSPPIHRHVVYFAQFCDAADMVSVAMGTQDSTQLQVICLQEGKYRLGFAWINHRSMLAVMNHPDIVVLQGGDGADFKGWAGKHLDE